MNNHNLETIKREAIILLKDNILKRKIDIHRYMDPKYKDNIYFHISEILLLLFKSRGIKIDQQQFDDLKEKIINEIVGYGAIDSLLRDPEITDILVNNPEQVYIEKKGKLERSKITLEDPDEINYLIDKMMLECGRRIDHSSPFVDFRLEGGARVTAVIPPVSPNNPIFSIRKILKSNMAFEDLKNYGTVNQKLIDFLRYCVKSRLNILVAGSTGTGKTTLINLMIKEMVPDDERIIMIEDVEEMPLNNSQHFIKLVTRPPNVEGKGEIDLRDLVKLSLHLRPDRIVIGEIRGEEAFYFLHALNTGHDGSMCTIHASNSEDALNRLEILALMDRPNIQPSVIRRFLTLGVDVVVHMQRLPNGQRIVSKVSDFTCDENGYKVNDIFSLKRNVSHGKETFEIKMTGVVPSFLEKMQSRTDITAGFFKAD